MDRLGVLGRRCLASWCRVLRPRRSASWATAIRLSTFASLRSLTLLRSIRSCLQKELEARQSSKRDRRLRTALGITLPTVAEEDRATCQRTGEWYAHALCWHCRSCLLAPQNSCSEISGRARTGVVLCRNGCTHLCQASARQASIDLWLLCCKLIAAARENSLVTSGCCEMTSWTFRAVKAVTGRDLGLQGGGIEQTTGT